MFQNIIEQDSPDAARILNSLTLNPTIYCRIYGLNWEKDTIGISYKGNHNVICGCTCDISVSFKWNTPTIGLQINLGLKIAT